MINQRPKSIWRKNVSQFLEIVDNKNNREGSHIREKVLYPRVLDHFGSVNRKTFLDAGCGEGIIGRLAMKRGAKAIGCDIAPQFLEEARRRSHNKEPVVLADLTKNLPFATSSFNVVCFNLVLMWLPEITRTAREAHRITKPEGRVIVSLLHPWTALSRIDQTDLEHPLLIISNNILERTYMRTINKTAGPYFYYQRSISEYINTFTNAGFQLKPGDGIEEVVAPQESNVSTAKKIFPEFAILTFIKSRCLI